MMNAVPKGFLSAYRKAKKYRTEYIPLAAGFLRLEYLPEEEHSLLWKVCFVEDNSEYSKPLGKFLELSLDPHPDSQEDNATFIGENEVSGLQWSKGAVQWGHTYEDDSGPSDQRVIPLDEWVDECIQIMINPADTDSGNGGKQLDIRESIKTIKKSEADGDRFWKKATPRTVEDARLMLDHLEKAAANNDGEMLFTLSDPLKRAKAGDLPILETVTAILEKESSLSPLNRSELQEILEAFADKAPGALASRWMELCNKSIAANGIKALHAINAASLFISITKVKNPDSSLLAFSKKVLSMVESSDPALREDVVNLYSYIDLKKMAKRIKKNI